MGLCSCCILLPAFIVLVVLTLYYFEKLKNRTARSSLIVIKIYSIVAFIRVRAVK